MHGLLQHSHLITGFPYLRLQPPIPSPAMDYVWNYYSIYYLFLCLELLSLSLLWKTEKTWCPFSPHTYFFGRKEKGIKKTIKSIKKFKGTAKSDFHSVFLPNPQFLPSFPSESCSVSFPCSLLFSAASFSHHAKMPWSHLALPSGRSHTINWEKRRIFPASMRIAVCMLLSKSSPF